MSNEESAKAAADGMHGKNIEGRAIVARLRSGGRKHESKPTASHPADATAVRQMLGLFSSNSCDLLALVTAVVQSFADAAESVAVL